MNKIIILLLFLCSVVFSQNNAIVTDYKKNPLPDVDIYFADLDLLLISDENGLFAIPENISKKNIIEFYKLGYESLVVKLEDSNNLVFKLRKLHVELDEIGIQEIVSNLGNYKLINIEKKSLSNNFSSSTTLVDNLNQISGINYIGSGLGIQKLVIRALSGLRVVTYLNGMRIGNQEWANDHSIGFTDLGLGKIELIKGSTSLKFGGDAVGGILYFKDEPFVNSKNPSGYIATKFDNSHSLIGNQFGLKLSKNNLYFNLHGEYTKASDYKLPNNDYLFNSRFENQAIKFSLGRLGSNMQNVFRYQYNGDKVGIPAHAHGDLSSITLYDVTSSSLDLPDDYDMTRPTQFIENHLFTFDNNYQSDNIKYNLFIGHFINNLQEYEKWTIPAFDMNLNTSSLKFNLDYMIYDLGINSGFQFNRQENINNINGRLLPDGLSNDIGLYTTIDYTKENIGFNSGFRYDLKNIKSKEYNFDKVFHSFNSSHGFYFEHNNHLARLTYSSSYRAPHLSELFSFGLHHGTMRFEIGNRDLEIEKSHQIDFKYQWNDEHFGVVINPFVQFIDNFIAINPTDSLYSNIYRIYDYVQFKSARISGSEINLHYHPHFFHNLHLEQSYTFVNAYNIDNDSPLAFIPSNKIKSKLNIDLIDYNFPLGVKSFSIYHIYSFKQSNIAEYEYTTDSYDVLNAEIMFNFFKKIDFVFSLKNILNREYTPHISRVREVAGGVPEVGRSFFVSMKYEF